MYEKRKLNGSSGWESPEDRKRIIRKTWIKQELKKYKWAIIYNGIREARASVSSSFSPPAPSHPCCVTTDTRSRNNKEKLNILIWRKKKKKKWRNSSKALRPLWGTRQCWEKVLCKWAEKEKSCELYYNLSFSLNLFAVLFLQTSHLCPRKKSCLLRRWLKVLAQRIKFIWQMMVSFALE